MAILLLLPLEAADDDYIEAVKPTMRNHAADIVIDGLSSDWRGIPLYADFNEGEAIPTEKAAWDLAGFGLVIDESALTLRVETVARPTTASSVYWFDFDIVGRIGTEFQIGIRPPSTIRLGVFPPGGGREGYDLDDVEIAIGECVETRIPIGLILANLPIEFRDLFNADAPRPWVRMRPFSWDGRKLDEGTAVATYRLDPHIRNHDELLPSHNEVAPP